MQQKSLQRHFRVVVILEGGKTRIVDVKASSREVAEDRAMKRVGGAIDISRAS